MRPDSHYAMGTIDMHQVNFLPWRMNQLIHQRRYFFIIIFTSCMTTATIFGYLVGLLLLDISQNHYRLAAHQQHQQRTEQLKIQLQTQQQQLEKLTLRQIQRRTYTQHNQSLLDLLTSLSNLTPPKSWLSSFQLQAGHLEVNALSYRFEDLNVLLAQFSQTPQVSNVQLRKLRRVDTLHQLHLIADYQGVSNE